MSSYHNPLVSIIIPVYNCKKYVIDAVESCLAQKYKNIEVLCVDDGSTDGSYELLESTYAGNPQVHLIHQWNQGGCVARNRGLEDAKGMFVKFLDSDDVLFPDAIEKQVAHLADLNDSNHSIVCGSFVETDHDLREKQICICPYSESTKFSYWYYSIGVSSPLFPKQALFDLRGFDVKLPFAQESDLIVRAAILGWQFEMFPNDMIYKYRQHNKPNRLRNTVDYASYPIFLSQMNKLVSLMVAKSCFSEEEKKSVFDYFMWKIESYRALERTNDCRQAIIELQSYVKEHHPKTSFSEKIQMNFMYFKMINTPRKVYNVLHKVHKKMFPNHWKSILEILKKKH